MATKAASIRWALEQAIATRENLTIQLEMAQFVAGQLHQDPTPTIAELQEHLDALNEHIPNLELMAKGNYDGPTLLRGEEMQADPDYKRRDREFNSVLNPKPPIDEIKKRQEERIAKRPKIGE